ncbi:MAG TPA: exopolysaccharide biosynthesis polyprenyl glycosylphosphotransferase [Bradyrhizobium sp.]|jgi:exopolysaccharide biosynthesis polyprenyl glycosylphosphotransferase
MHLLALNNSGAALSNPGQIFQNPSQQAAPALHGVSTDFFGVLRFAPANDHHIAANANDRKHRNEIAKRVFDLLIAVPALLILSPLLLVAALIIRLDSTGPVLFRQTRLGRDGKPFSILKFRSMRVMENGDKVVQAQQNDSRVTRAGKWLRSTSIDELPQLLNVLRGDMSIIGPRPHARAHDEHYASVIPHYALRQSVKPGITGWAQVHGHRGETATVQAMRARVDFDIWYANNATLFTDIEILLRTPLEVLSARNAY